MAIVISDIHGNLEVARAFLSYKPSEQHICLGDTIDSRITNTLADELACLDLLIESDIVLLWGNHELAYLPERPWRWHTKYSLGVDEVQHYIGKSGWLAQRYKENGDLFAGDVFTARIHNARADSVLLTLSTTAGSSPMQGFRRSWRDGFLVR